MADIDKSLPNVEQEIKVPSPEEIESPFGLKAADQFSRDFMAKGGIMSILKK